LFIIFVYFSLFYGCVNCEVHGTHTSWSLQGSMQSNLYSRLLSAFGRRPFWTRSWGQGCQAVHDVQQTLQTFIVGWSEKAKT